MVIDGSAMAAGSVPGELTDACADVTPAGPADVVADRPARYVAAPASTAEAAALLRAAAALGLTVVPRGSGSRLDWGAAPASCDLIVDTRRLDQVLEHAAGDLVVSVQAGVRLDDLAKSCSRQKASDSHSTRRRGGTIGGIIATQAAGRCGSATAPRATCSSASPSSGPTARSPRPAARSSRTWPATTSASCSPARTAPSA